MEKTYSDIKAVLAHRKRRFTMQGYREFRPPTADATLRTIEHIEWLRTNEGKFPNRPRREEIFVKTKSRRATPCAAACKYCKQRMQFGTKGSEHGIGKCVPVCEECGFYQAKIKSEDGYQLCTRCDREFNQQHVPDTKVSAHAPIVLNAIIYERPVYQKPTITRLDIDQRRTVDYGSLYGGGY
jgi:hypothetical protein